jgi:hypothetical protein
MDSNDIAKHIDVLDRMAKARDPRSFVEMTIWHPGHSKGRYVVTAHYIEHISRAHTAYEAIEGLYRMLLNGTGSKPNADALAATLGLNDTPSWIDGWKPRVAS